MNGTTVTEICRKANVTTGALQHQFGSKGGLMTEVLSHLFSPFIVDEGMSAISGGTLSERIHGKVDHYWRIYGDDRYFVIIEVLLAARYDVELMRMVAKYRLQQLRMLEDTLPLEFGDVDLPAQELKGSIQRMLDLLRGYAVHRLYERSDEQDARVLETAREMVERDFLPHAKNGAAQ